MSAIWNTADAPKDGSEIIAVGRVICSDEFSTYVNPFVAAIHWEAASGCYEGWHLSNGLAVARTMDDEVMVDWWAPYPR